MKSDSSTLNVFVYGTLKPGEANFAAYCQDQVIAQTPAYTWGELYALPVGYPAMTQGNSKVQGILLSFGDSQAYEERNQQVLQSLDRLEDYHPERTADLNQYHRALANIYSLDDRQITTAWAYYMTEAKVREYRGVKLTSGYWTGK